MLQAPSPSRRIRMWLFVASAIVAVLILVRTAYAAAQDMRGGETTATVITVYGPEAYTVSFTTTSGEPCVSPHKWTVPAQVGDTFRIHYSTRLPCSNFRRADDTLPWYTYVITAVLLSAAIILVLHTVHQRLKSDPFARLVDKIR